MKKAFIATLLVLASLSSAAASLEGTIRAINDQSGTRIGSTVDHWKFTARSTGLVAIDVLSWEARVTRFDRADAKERRRNRLF